MNHRFLVAFAALLAGLAGPALAQQPTQAQIGAIRQSCRADYQSHCADVPTGGKAALACLQQNAASLSPSCQQAVAAASGGAARAAAPNPPAANPAGASRQGQGGSIRESCRMDYRTLCRGVRPGGGRAIACLADHQASLSPDCAQALDAMRQRR